MHTHSARSHDVAFPRRIQRLSRKSQHLSRQRVHDPVAMKVPVPGPLNPQTARNPLPEGGKVCAVTLLMHANSPLTVKNLSPEARKQPVRLQVTTSDLLLACDDSSLPAEVHVRRTLEGRLSFDIFVMEFGQVGTSVR